MVWYFDLIIHSWDFDRLQKFKYYKRFMNNIDLKILIYGLTHFCSFLMVYLDLFSHCDILIIKEYN